MPNADPSTGISDQSPATLPAVPVDGDSPIRVSQIAKSAVLKSLLDIAVSKEGCSDIFLTPQNRACFKVHGKLTFTNLSLSAKEIEDIWSIESNPRLRERLREERAANFAFDHSSGQRFRVHVACSVNGLTFFMRALPSIARSVEDLGLPPQLVDLVDQSRGLILVTGQTGSGKTTTLAALCQRLVDRSGHNLVTLEDPVEYRLKAGEKSIVTQREVGIDCPSFGDGIDDSLRENPSVVMIGEIRKPREISAAITAAETGPLVLTTLHTRSAAASISRIIDVIPEGERDDVREKLASSLVGVLTQVLVPKAQGPGRVAAYEFMRVTAPVQAHIRKNEIFKIPSTMQLGTNTDGQLTMENHMRELIKKGLITAEAAKAALPTEDRRRALSGY